RIVRNYMICNPILTFRHGQVKHCFLARRLDGNDSIPEQVTAGHREKCLVLQKLRVVVDEPTRRREAHGWKSERSASHDCHLLERNAASVHRCGHVLANFGWKRIDVRALTYRLESQPQRGNRRLTRAEPTNGFAEA